MELANVTLEDTTTIKQVFHKDDLTVRYSKDFNCIVLNEDIFISKRQTMELINTLRQMVETWK